MKSWRFGLTAVYTAAFVRIRARSWLGTDPCRAMEPRRCASSIVFETPMSSQHSSVWSADRLAAR